MGALAASIASHVPSGLLSAGLAVLSRPGDIVRRAARLEDEFKELLIRMNGAGGRAGSGAEQGEAQHTRDRFLRAYERLKSELLSDRAFNFDFTEETRQWVAKVQERFTLLRESENEKAKGRERSPSKEASGSKLCNSKVVTNKRKVTEMRKLEIKDKEKTLFVHDISHIAKEKDLEVKPWDERHAKGIPCTTKSRS